MANDLLFEIGVEEIPASYVRPALAELRDALESELASARLEPSTIDTYATPRRLTLVACGVPDRQEDAEREAVGPPVSVAFAGDGSPTKAAIGFAKSQGVAVSDLGRKTTDRGDYIYVRVTDVGRDAAEVLPGCLAAAVAAVGFPKTMRWGPKERFARPIRSFVAMLGGDVLDFSYAGVSAGNATLGHRIWAPGPHVITGAGDYLDVLERNFVIADIERRRDMIRKAAIHAAAGVGGTLVEDDDLLNEVTFLVEFPTVFAGRFDERFLELPRDVIIAAMKGHQRYFAVEADGALLPWFLCVTNTPPDNVEGIRGGNERVLVSRLDDAEFYWEEDTRTSLADKVDSLRNVVWLEGLGSLYEKTQRLERLAREIGTAIGSSETETAVRAAHLAKADLVTEMVKDGKEFTELQGVMGKEYALQSNEPPGVAAAILDHYRPRSASDDLPRSEAGTILSMADRLDSIVGCFSVGLVPSGSQDPYALRRQAIGLVRMILENGLRISPVRLVGAAVDGLGVRGADREQLNADALDFIRQRARNVFIDAGYTYDLVDAVLGASFDDLVGARERLDALTRFREAEDFEGLVIGARRATNILKDQEKQRFDPARFVEEQSRALAVATDRAGDAVSAALENGDLDAAVRELLGLRRPIDEFFDHVLVMVDDPDLRSARLGLLARVRELFLKVADFAKVVLAGEERTEGA